MISYNLNLTEDYCAHWTLENAVRELLANTIDEGGSIEYDYSQYMLHLRTDSIIPIEAFLMGYSDKKTSNPIGQYGEGLKIAILILVREGINFSFDTNKHTYSFLFKKPEGFTVPTLHVILTPSEELGPEADYTNISVSVPSGLFEGLYTNAPLDELILDSKGLYCQGLLVEPNWYIRGTHPGQDTATTYGVNLNTPLDNNRDRTVFMNKEALIPILEKQLDPEFFVDFDSSDNLQSILSKLSDEFAQRVVKAYLHIKHKYDYKILNQKHVIIPPFYSSSGTTYAKHKNYFVAKVSWYYADALSRGNDTKILKELEIKDEDNTVVFEPIAYKPNVTKRYEALAQAIENAEDLEQLVAALLHYMPLTKTDRSKLKDQIIDQELFEKVTDLDFLEI